MPSPTNVTRNEHIRVEHKPFELKADYAPAGDQPEAIARMVEGLRTGLSHQTLLWGDGIGQDIFDRQCDSAGTAPDAGPRS